MMQLPKQQQIILENFLSYCIQQHLHICCAESLTCGNLQAAFGSIPGISKIFAGGITAYNLEQKSYHLGVDRAEAEDCNCISQSIADQMAKGACELFHADIGFATTGYAQASQEYKVAIPFAYISCYDRNRGLFVFQEKITGTDQFSRIAMQEFVMKKVINLIQSSFL